MDWYSKEERGFVSSGLNKAINWDEITSILLSASLWAMDHIRSYDLMFAIGSIL